ncbi:MAG: SH3 domain-containing protein [Chloroflexota bacterium]
MKRLVLFVLGCVFALMVAPTLAQTPAGEVILLDDSTPSVTANVSLPLNATGVVSLNLNNASVTVTDSSGKAIFQMSDGRVHNIELSIVPNSGAQIIKVERLPGVAQAGVSITALSELSSSGATAQSVSTNSLTTNQEQSLQLDATKPGATVQLNIPAEGTGIITSTYFGSNVTSQLLDNNGSVVATSFGGAIDGIKMVLDGGNYGMTLVGNNLSNPITAGVQVMPVSAANFVALQLPAATQVPVVVSAPATAVPQTVAVACTATVTGTAVNLRTGPGTGYEVIAYGHQNETYPVGGTNPEQSWVVVGLPNGSAWVTKTLISLSGACDNLTVFNITLRNSQPAQIVTIPSANTVNVGASQSNNNSGSSGSSGGQNEGQGGGDD